MQLIFHVVDVILHDIVVSDNDLSSSSWCSMCGRVWYHFKRLCLVEPQKNEEGRIKLDKRALSKRGESPQCATTE